MEYWQGDTVLEGFAVFPAEDNVAGRPGVLVVPEWNGIDAYSHKRAAMLAELGYVAFVADIYGKGIRPQGEEEAAAEAGKYRADRALFRARVTAGFEILRQLPGIDTTRLAAIGYCFGGQAVLELARSGADLLGVVSFHGALDTPTPEDARHIRASVLALHGADDPIVPAEAVRGFEAEMRNGGVDWQLVVYGGAVHAFTNWNCGDDPSQGAAYNAKADHRSWAAMRSFLDEVFAG
jgi:dienelactone hydrolase